MVIFPDLLVFHGDFPPLSPSKGAAHCSAPLLGHLAVGISELGQGLQQAPPGPGVGQAVRKTMGKPWENHGKTMENYGKTNQNY